MRLASERAITHTMLIGASGAIQLLPTLCKIRMRRRLCLIWITADVQARSMRPCTAEWRAAGALTHSLRRHRTIRAKTLLSAL